MTIIPPRPFHRAELWLLMLLAVLALGTVGLDLFHPARVDWPAFLLPVGASLMLIAIGAYIRLRKPMPRMASFAIALGVFMAFSALVAIFIFLLFPFPRPMIDATLIRLDAALGYDWAGFVAGIARYPAFGTVLGWIYLSAIPQLVLVMVVLAAMGRDRALHQFLMVGMLGMAVAVGIWWLAPSIGPSAYVAIPAEVAQPIGLVVDSGYGAMLQDLAARGIDLIRPDRIIGVIAFPSFHIIMACMVVWFTRATPVFWPGAVANGLMVPATLGHGGHHLIDLLAGIGVFALVLFLSRRLLRHG